MKLDIVIPTLNRQEKLTNCLNSIFLAVLKVPPQHHIRIYLYFSIRSEYDYYKSVFGNIDEVHVEFVEHYKVPDFWNSHLVKMTADAMLYANDDVELFNNTLEQVVRKFETDILDYDGVLGLSQSNLPASQTLEGAFGVIGRTFADRFPNRSVWCGDYYRFRADWELWKYSKSINKFWFYTDIKIQHFHPAYNKDLVDDTHKNVRQYLQKDNETFKIRQAHGYLWGRDYNLINKD